MAGWVNNGTSRSLKVTVDKQVGGNPVQGYPKTYDGQQAFPGYAALTDEEARRLTSSQFTTRYNAFVIYVESIEVGADFDTDVVGTGAIIASDPNCLATTTTTTAAPTTTTTSAPTTTTTTAAPADLFVGYTKPANEVAPDYNDTNTDTEYITTRTAGIRLWFCTQSVFGSGGIALTNNVPVEITFSPKTPPTTGSVITMRIYGSDNITNIPTDPVGGVDISAGRTISSSILSGSKFAYVDMILDTDETAGNGYEFTLSITSSSGFKTTHPLKASLNYGWIANTNSLLLGDFSVKSLV